MLQVKNNQVFLNKSLSSAPPTYTVLTFHLITR